jgi:hypothetical protein
MESGMDDPRMGLEEEVDRLMREAAAKSSLGMAAWVSGEGGVADDALPREGELELEALRRIFLASRDFTLAMLTGQAEAIRLLAREIEALSRQLP